MSEKSPDVQTELPTRPPSTLTEHVLANCRPKPAIPAVAALWIMTLMPLVLVSPESFWLVGVIALGILVSVGLAIGAGFCSLFPQAIWSLLAVWGLSLAQRGGFPAFIEYLFYLGIALCVAMFGLQVYRIFTGRFVPTLPVYPQGSDPV